MSHWHIAALICAAIGIVCIWSGVRTSEKGGADAWGAEIIGVAAGVVALGVAVVLAIIGWVVG